MKKIKDKKEIELQILRNIHNSKQINQRNLSKHTGFSLGKVNYCIKELKKKGLVKLINFINNKKKISYLYILTPKGISKKTKLTLDFLERKYKEYEDLRSEINKENEEVK
jgi:EPS-associated MarR family transcriptional regulator